MVYSRQQGVLAKGLTPLNALHSMYAAALMSERVFSPCSLEIVDWPDFCSSALTLASFLRSLLQHTRMIGTCGQKCLTSGTHWGTFASGQTRWRREHAVSQSGGRNQPHHRAVLLAVLPRGAQQLLSEQNTGNHKPAQSALRAVLHGQVLSMAPCHGQS